MTSILTATRRAIEALDLAPTDGAAAALAEALARQLDLDPEPADFARFSGQLAALLAQLGGTPGGRAKIGKGAKGAPVLAVNPLAEHRLRAVK